MESIISKIAFQQAFAIDHRIKIIEVYEMVRGAIFLKPFIKRENPTRRALSKKILRLWSVIVYRENRRKDHLNVVRVGKLGEVAEIRLDVFVRDRSRISGN